MNDPNGLIYFDNAFHLFYQHYPEAPEWGPMHWGHARSKDLIHWENAPVALIPSEEYDRGVDSTSYGCFSGSAIESDGQLILMYTGHVENREVMQSQNIASSKDGIHFAKSPRNPVIAEPPIDCSRNFRDPKLFRANGKVFAVVGGEKDGIGKALLYEAADKSFTNWVYRGVAAQSNGSQGTMWECPDIIIQDKRDALIYSPMQGTLNVNPHVMVGKFDADDGKFVPSSDYILDYGVDFYAPQTFKDPQGRDIMIGWMQQWFQRNITAEFGWAGAMTIPREVIITENRVFQRPARELESLRGAPHSIDATHINDSGIAFTTGECAEVKIRLTVTSGPGAIIGLRVNDDRVIQTRYVIDWPNKRLICDRSQSGLGDTTSVEMPIDAVDGTIDLHFYIDRCSIELFADKGAHVLTSRVYPTSPALEAYIEPLGDSKIEIREMKTWELREAIAR